MRRNFPLVFLATGRHDSRYQVFRAESAKHQCVGTPIFVGIPLALALQNTAACYAI